MRGGVVQFALPMLTAGTMTEHTSPLLRTLAERGYIHQTTDAAALDAAMGLGDLPPAIDVHEGLQDGSMASIQDYVHNHQR